MKFQPYPTYEECLARLKASFANNTRRVYDAISPVERRILDFYQQTHCKRDTIKNFDLTEKEFSSIYNKARKLEGFSLSSYYVKKGFSEEDHIILDYLKQHGHRAGARKYGKTANAVYYRAKRHLSFRCTQEKEKTNQSL